MFFTLNWHISICQSVDQHKIQIFCQLKKNISVYSNSVDRLIKPLKCYGISC